MSKHPKFRRNVNRTKRDIRRYGTDNGDEPLTNKFQRRYTERAYKELGKRNPSDNQKEHVARNKKSGNGNSKGLHKSTDMVMPRPYKNKSRKNVDKMLPWTVSYKTAASNKIKKSPPKFNKNKKRGYTSHKVT